MTMMELNRWDNWSHCDTFLTPNVFQFIRLYNEGQRHGRGTYLFFFVCTSLFAFGRQQSCKSLPAEILNDIFRFLPFSDLSLLANLDTRLTKVSSL
jgi:hypothetical protein